MRLSIILCITVALALILCPLVSLAKTKPEQTVMQAVTLTDEAREDEYISVMLSSDGRVRKTSMREYVIGCVAAEMPAVYHGEAIKAQAVAVYTYAKKVCEQNKKHGVSEYGNADITDSPEIHQGYIDKDARKEKWGEHFEEYEEKTEQAVDCVFGKYLEYEGETALSVYHAISAGATQSASDMWGSDIPYLISVESTGDRLSPDYSEKTVFTQEEFCEKAKKCGAEPGENAEEWLGKTDADENGYVRSVQLGSKSIAASKIREIFEIRSHAFDVEYDGSNFIFTSYGYGHGVGMSQYGADYMARQGFTWQEILMHYYPGTDIV